MTRAEIPISDWGRVLTDLMANREALGWNERLALATAVGRQLGQKNRDAEPVALAFVLADDASPEIRKAIAEALVHLDEEDFAKLAAKLSSDTNAFVKTAAERAMKRRRRSAQQTQRTRRNLGAVANRVASFEGTYGAEATKRLRRIADDQFSALVRQTDHDLRQILSPIKTSIASLNRQFDGTPNPQFCKDTLREMDRRMVYLEQFLADLPGFAAAMARIVEIMQPMFADWGEGWYWSEVLIAAMRIHATACTHDPDAAAGLPAWIEARLADRSWPMQREWVVTAYGEESVH